MEYIIKIHIEIALVIIFKFIDMVAVPHVGGEDGTARRHRPINYAAAAAISDHGTNNFATIRTTSIVTKQQKEHMQVSGKQIFFFDFKALQIVYWVFSVSYIVDNLMF